MRDAENIGALDLRSRDAGGAQNGVQFADERTRPNRDIEPPYAASVTLSASDGSQSWGEFFSLEDVAMLRQWCDRLLDDELKRRIVS